MSSEIQRRLLKTTTDVGEWNAVSVFPLHTFIVGVANPNPFIYESSTENTATGKMNKLCKALLCGTFFFILNKANAQPNYFSESFGHPVYLDLAKGVTVDLTDSTFYAMDANGGVLMVHFDRNGNIIDSFFFTRLGSNGINCYQELWGSLKWLNDSILFSGGAFANASLLRKGCLYFFNKQLDTLPIKVFGNDLQNIAYRAMLLPGKKIALGGEATISTTDAQAWVVLTDSNGSQIWDKNYGGTEEDVAVEVLPFPDNHYLVCAGKKISGDYHPWLFVLDTLGNLVNQHEFNTPAFRCSNIDGIASISGNYIFWGCLDTIINSGDYQYPRYLMKTDTGFNILWRHEFTYYSHKEIGDLIELTNGDIAVCGVVADSNGSFGWIARVDSMGNLLWEHYYSFDSDSSWNGFYDIQQVWDGGFIMSGTTDAIYGSSQNQDAWLVRVDSNGCLVPGCFTSVPPVEVEPTLSWNIFPNPAGSETEIDYNLPPQMRNAVLQVININGQVMKQITLSNREHSLTLSVNDMPTGIYLVRLQTGSGVSEIKKLILAR